ncbi:MAG: glycosyltransferase [bacterium]
MLYENNLIKNRELEIIKEENYSLRMKIQNLEDSLTWRTVQRFDWLIKPLLIDTGIIRKKSKVNKIKSGEGNIFLKLRREALEDFKWRFPKANNPLVSIVIPVCNKFHFTINCLASIFINTDVSYEVIIVDNGSKDKTKLLGKKLKNIKVIKNEKNMGFGKACNQGVKASKGKYVLFLNNDTIVTKGWLSSLVKSIENNSKYGAVGSKLIKPDGRLQEAGSIIYSNGFTKGYGRGENPEKPEFCFLREVDYCSAACLLVRRDLFNQIGGFDDIYSPARFEDVDICMEIRKRGYKVVYQPNSIVYHYEFGSSGSQEEVGELDGKNRIKFVEKWGDILKKEYNDSSLSELFLRSRGDRKKILFIDEKIPTLDKGGGYPRAHVIVSLLRELGYDITIFPLQDSLKYSSTKELQELGIEVFYGDDLNFERFSLERKRFYDVIIVSRPNNMMQVSQYKSFLKDSILIYDAEALFSVREVIKDRLMGKKINKKDAESLIDKEIGLTKGAEIVTTVSENEKESFVKRGIKDVFILSHGCEIRDKTPGFKERKDILFIGGYLVPDSPNEDAILYFVKEIFPKIKKELDCKLYIVGDNKSEEIEKLSSDSIIIAGYVKNLEEYYDRCKVFVVPHRFSAGIPLKLFGAMANGIPSVISELTASQMSFKNEEICLIGRNKDDFAKKVIQLYGDEEVWNSLRRNSLKFIKENGSLEKMKKDLNIMMNFALKKKGDYC